MAQKFLSKSILLPGAKCNSDGETGDMAKLILKEIRPRIIEVTLRTLKACGRAHILLNYLFTYFLTYFLPSLHTYLLPHVLTYILTYLLTVCSRVVLDKLTGSQPVKKFPAFC